MAKLGLVGRLRESVRDSGLLWTASLILDRVLPIGPLGLWPPRRVSAEDLARQVERILLAWGMSSEHASITVGHMLYADLHGIDSHGCAMLPHYRSELRDGSLTMTPAIRVVRESAASALVDGGGGLGHVPADTAMKLAMAKCRSSGTAAVGVRNSGHYGAAGAYAAMAARSGLIGMATTSTRVPALVPTFGAAAMLGTNPIAIAAPAARNQPFVLDMATSTVPLGALAMASRTGRSIPAGWAVDPRGRPVTNPRRAIRYRRLTPLGGGRETGGHKGYGLAVAVEILSSLLPGRRDGCGAAEAPAEEGVGHFFLAIDPSHFRDAGQFEVDLDATIDSLRATPPLGAQPVAVAGDPEHAAFAERRRAGIPLTRSVVEDLRSICRAAGVPYILDADR